MHHNHCQHHFCLILDLRPTTPPLLLLLQLSLLSRQISHHSCSHGKLPAPVGTWTQLIATVVAILHKYASSTTIIPHAHLTIPIDGGACVAMVGKDCVAIACDLRLGMQALTVSNNFPKIFQYGDVFLGLTGLATDVSTVSDLFRYKVNMYRLREERNISPQTMANLVSSSLYERRFGPYFISPVIAGINQTSGKPFICGFDSIGCIDFAKDFIVSGTASDQLFGTCEGLWEPDLVGSSTPLLL